MNKDMPIKLYAIQIEVSTICTSKCFMCPHTTFYNMWESKLMDMQLYLKISNYFDNAEYVHLQGWGEPLHHPKIIEMIKIAKEHKCKVGLTTNAQLINKYAPDLVKLLDMIVISIGGASKYTHERVRTGNDFETLINNTKLLIENRKDNKKPKIIFSYLMNKYNIEELPKAIELAAKIGVDEFLATNLDYIPIKELNSTKIFSHTEKEDTHIERIIKESIKISQINNITLTIRPRMMNELPVCLENPLRNLFITVNGLVTPCVYVHLPIKAENIPRIFNDKKYTIKKLYFGNLQSETLDKIWQSEKYIKFREIFEQRMHVYEHTILFEDTFKNIMPPKECITCYKIYGI
ncbi:MAG: radical SAM/SPASM domain-containing protein [Thermoprotei archaeon]|jgi:MoaA/NifB/PqqE/SkfB family radical SAM enzyme